MNNLDNASTNSKYKYVVQKLQSFGDISKENQNAVFDICLNNNNFSDDELIRCYDIVQELTESYNVRNNRVKKIFLTLIENTDNLERKLSTLNILSKYLYNVGFLYRMPIEDLKTIFNTALEQNIPNHLISKTILKYDFSNYNIEDFLEFLSNIGSSRKNTIIQKNQSTNNTNTSELGSIDNQQYNSIRKILSKYPQTNFTSQQLLTIYNQYVSKNLTEINLKTIINYCIHIQNLAKPDILFIENLLIDELSKDDLSDYLSWFKEFEYLTYHISQKNNIDNNFVVRCLKSIKEHNNNTDFTHITKDEFETLQGFHSLYCGLYKNFPDGNQISTKDKKSITNQTFDKIIEYYTQNKDINLDQTQITNYLGILEEFNTKISRYNRSDMFSNNDYINFITKQQNNFVFTCNYDKAKINRNIILNHIQKIRNNITTDNLQYTINIGKTTSKDIIVKRPSLLLVDSHKIYESCLFLQGKSSSEIFNNTLNDLDDLNIEYPTKSKNRRDELINIFPDIKITNINSDKQNLIFDKFTSFLHILNLKNICTFTAQITTAISLAYVNNSNEDISTTKAFVESLGYNTSNFFSGKNIFTIFNKNNTAFSDNKVLNQRCVNNITENIKVLKDYLQPQAIQKIILDNFNILIQDTQTIKDILKSTNDKSEENILSEIIKNNEDSKQSNSLRDILNYTKVKQCKSVDYSKDGTAKLLLQIRSNNYNTHKSHIMKIDKALNLLEHDLYGDEEITKEKIDATNQEIDATLKSLEIKKEHLSEVLADLEKESLWYHKYNRTHNKNFELKDDDYLSVQQELDKQLESYDYEYSDISSQLGDIKQSEILKFLKARKTIEHKDSMIANIKVEISAIDMIIAKLTLLKDTPLNKEVTKNLRFITNILDSFIEVLETSGGLLENQEKVKRIRAGITHANENIKKLTGVDILETRVPSDTNNNDETPSLDFE